MDSSPRFCSLKLLSLLLIPFYLSSITVPISAFESTHPFSEKGEFNLDTSQLVTPSREPIKYLAIAGGGARGVVLLGAFEVFLEHKEFYAPVSEMFGTSVGAIASALIASGISIPQLKELGQVNFAEIIGPQIIRNRGTQLTRFLAEHIQYNIRERLTSDPIPLERLSLLSEEDQYLYCEILSNLDPLRPIRHVRITFRMLELLHRLDPLHFKKLSLTATCINTSSPETARFVLSAETTPDLDIAIACRASASIPIFFTPVYIQREFFSDQTLLSGLDGEDPILIDGGWLQNIPIYPIEKRAEDATSLEKLRNETLVLVYEESLGNHKYSIFDPRRPIPSPSIFDKLMMDLFVPNVGQFKHLPSATKTAYRDLVHLKTHYPYTHILSFPTHLKTTDFEDAARSYKKYTDLGRAITNNYFSLFPCNSEELAAQ